MAFFDYSLVRKSHPRLSFAQAHVLKVKDALYSVVLGSVSIQDGRNSFYKLQVLEHDKKSKWWVGQHFLLIWVLYIQSFIFLLSFISGMSLGHGVGWAPRLAATRPRSFMRKTLLLTTSNSSMRRRRETGWYCMHNVSDFRHWLWLTPSWLTNS